MNQAADWQIVPFEKSHNRRSFDCGEERLNNWLQDLAPRFHNRGYGQVYCAIDSDCQVAGCYSLSCHAVRIDLVPPGVLRRPPRLPDIPTVLLGKLAVRSDLQGKRLLGPRLLVHAMSRTLKISEIAGAKLMEVVALTERAREFYLKFDFQSLLDDRKHLFLQVETIREAVKHEIHE